MEKRRDVRYMHGSKRFDKYLVNKLIKRKKSWNIIFHFEKRKSSKFQ